MVALQLSALGVIQLGTQTIRSIPKPTAVAHSSREALDKLYELARLGKVLITPAQAT